MRDLLTHKSRFPEPGHLSSLHTPHLLLLFFLATAIVDIDAGRGTILTVRVMGAITIVGTGDGAGTECTTGICKFLLKARFDADTGKID